MSNFWKGSLTLTNPMSFRKWIINLGGEWLEDRREREEARRGKEEEEWEGNEEEDEGEEG